MIVVRYLHKLSCSPIGAAVLLCILSMMFAACAAEVWSPVGGIQRAAVAKGQVVFLDSPPTAAA